MGGVLAWVRCERPAIIVLPASVRPYVHTCDEHRPDYEEDYTIKAIPRPGDDTRCDDCAVWHVLDRRQVAAARWVVLDEHMEHTFCETHCVEHELFPLPDDPPQDDTVDPRGPKGAK